MRFEKIVLTIVLAGLFNVINVDGQSPVLLKDINQQDAPSYRSPWQFLEHDGYIYFVGEDLTHGPELFRLDPLTDKVELVKDLYPGGGHPSISNLIIFNETLHFSGYNEVVRAEIFKTDGTAEGTVNVTNNEGYYGVVNRMIVMNGSIYAVASWGNTGYELWKSDGTEAGTMLIKDIDPGLNSGLQFHLTPFKNEIYFVARNSASGNELWKSDGTPEGTIMLKDIVPGSSGSGIFVLTTFGEFLYFNAETEEHGDELWRTDGSPEGTQLFMDINPGSNSSHARNFVVADSIMYFSAANENGQGGLWKTNGTVEGTVEIKTINPSNFSSHASIREITYIDSLLYFQASDGLLGRELWISDGTPEGTAPIDLQPGSKGSGPREFTKSGDHVFFQAQTDANGSEIWKTDGTSEGTVVLDLVPGDGSSFPTQLFSYNGVLYMRALNTLYKSDGTLAGTVPIDPLEGTSSAFYIDDRSIYPNLLGGANGHFFFQANDGIHLTELWKTDATTAGTEMVRDLFPNVDVFLNQRPRITNAIDGDSLLYFLPNHPTYGLEIWKTDGTADGTSILKDIGPGEVSGVPYYQFIINNDNKLIFWANDGEHGVEIWTSDGTSDGTKMVTDLVEGPGGISLYSFPEAGLGRIFFAHLTQEYGIELWVTDGTESGTYMLKDINPGEAHSEVRGLSFLNDTLYFWAKDGSAGPSIWKSDGTTAGTEKFIDVPNTSFYASGEAAIFKLGNIFYFTYDDGQHGSGLYQYDPQTDEISVVREINPGGDYFPDDLTLLNDKLIFIAQTDAHGLELWVSDGTTDGTMLLKDIVPGPGTPWINSLMVAAGKVFFIADDPNMGTVLWQTDGSSEGTSVVENSPVNVAEIKAYNGKLYIIAGNQEYGYELYTYDIKQEQFISFEPIDDKLYGEVPFMVDATSSADLPLDFSSSNQEVASIEGNMITIQNAGETVITANQAGNDIFTTAEEVHQTLLVQKANLTVTAEDTSRLEAEENPVFELVYNGFEYNDGPGDLDVLPVAVTDADVQSPAGTYEITVSGGEDNNYDFTYSNGILSVSELTGIQDKASAGTFKIYPVPAKTALFVESSDFTTPVYEILDISGKVYQQGKVTGGHIRLEALDPGSYMLVLEEAYRYMIMIR